MEKITIDREKCIGCGECAADCVSRHIELRDGQAYVREGSGCIGCGHCYAICPVGAVDMPDCDTSGLDRILNFTEIEPEKLLLALKSRRAVRRFTDEPVSDELVNMLLEAGRYSPTGSNFQLVHFAVMRDRENLRRAEAEGMRVFKATPWLAQQVEEMESLPDRGKDFFLNGATCVIVVGANHRIDASISASYMEIMAQSLGLGVYFCNYFNYAAKHSERLQKLFAMPEGIRPGATLVLGHTDVKYRRLPPRDAAKVVWC